MYVDENGRSILGVWNEEKHQWIMDAQGLLTVKSLAADARKRIESNSEAADAYQRLASESESSESRAVIIPFHDLSAEEIAEVRKEIKQQDELLRDIELALFEIEARANKVNEANQ